MSIWTCRKCGHQEPVELDKCPKCDEPSEFWTQRYTMHPWVVTYKTGRRKFLNVNTDDRNKVTAQALLEDKEYGYNPADLNIEDVREYTPEVAHEVITKRDPGYFKAVKEDAKVHNRQGTLICTTKGDLAITAYLNGDFDKANISEMQFAIINYAATSGLPVSNSLKQYGTMGTTAIEQSLEEGLLKWKE